MMNYCLDVNHEYQKAKSSFLRLSLLFSFIFTLVIVGDVLLIILAKEDYQINFIIAAVITVLFVWFAIFFFTIIYTDINGKYRYFKGYDSGLKPTDEIIFVEKSEDLSYVNGLYVYPLWVKYTSNLEGTDKVIYTFDDKLELKKGDRVTVTTYQRIVIKAEKHS